MTQRKANLPQDVPADVVEALDKLLTYLWYEERNDFETDSYGPCSSDHIFHTLKIVGDWIGWEPPY